MERKYAYAEPITTSADPEPHDVPDSRAHDRVVPV